MGLVEEEISLETIALERRANTYLVIVEIRRFLQDVAFPFHPLGFLFQLPHHLRRFACCKGRRGVPVIVVVQ